MIKELLKYFNSYTLMVRVFGTLFKDLDRFYVRNNNLRGLDCLSHSIL